MEYTMNNLYFKYDENLHRINAYDLLTNNLVSYIHIKGNEKVDESNFKDACSRWASLSMYNNDATFQGIDYNSWY
ncbi:MULTISPECIES: hypothetical protein [unclassified Sedimentibacter]|uniref:hypothetical protein n=1 Tax=unclassified Sedimentibacter TaxID=2649220 RepID=UPI001BD68CF7|nr:hypothetical protein [Sedimentibacter sp. MB35-C1]WMJ76406.1 hypothetical protein RBQ61_12310 [Sedimentibacter sp. MB35-C1]